MFLYAVSLGIFTDKKYTNYLNNLTFLVKIYHKSCLLRFLTKKSQTNASYLKNYPQYDRDSFTYNNLHLNKIWISLKSIL